MTEKKYVLDHSPVSWSCGGFLCSGRKARWVILPNVSALLTMFHRLLVNAARYPFSSCAGDSVLSCHGSVRGQEIQLCCFSPTVGALVVLDIWSFWHIAFSSLKKQGKGREDPASRSCFMTYFSVKLQVPIPLCVCDWEVYSANMYCSSEPGLIWVHSTVWRSSDSK